MEVIQSSANVRVAFSELIDLANERVGGQVLHANDDFFAEKENLIKAAAPVFIADKYTDLGKWMDGWESRRKRSVGYDHCIIKLGLPGEIHGLNINTAFFTGNYPEYASVEGCELNEEASAEDLQRASWQLLLPKSALSGGSQNFFPVIYRGRCTHLRLNIFPDGGVARLRVHGEVRPAKSKLQGLVDVAAASTGGIVVTANDMYFGQKDNLIYPGRAVHMGEGWETRRKRGPGHDWIIVKLAGPAKLQKIEVDTHHFKGNFPDRCSVEGLVSLENFLPCDFRDRSGLEWQTLLGETKLQADHSHVFSKELKSIDRAYTYLRVNIYPDGGVSRLRVWGTLEKTVG